MYNLKLKSYLSIHLNGLGLWANHDTKPNGTILSLRKLRKLQKNIQSDVSKAKKVVGWRVEVRYKKNLVK